MASRFARSLRFVPTLLFALLSAGCGDKGEGDDGTDNNVGGSGGTGQNAGGSGGAAPATILYGFDADTQGFQYELYTPDDTTYTNKGQDSTLSWDDGPGADGKAGRLKLEVPFDGYNQLADIQINFPEEDWTGKTLRAQVLLESGFSPDPSAPGGSYLFVKTGADWVWGKGSDANVAQSTAGTWQKLAFRLSAPSNNNPGFDATLVKALGIQFYSGAGPASGEPAPTSAVLYVDHFTIE